MGDTTKKLKAAFEATEQLYNQKKDEHSQTNTEYRRLGQVIGESTHSQKEIEQAEAELPKVKEKAAKLFGAVAMLKKKVAVIEERYLYYEQEKAKFQKMLADGEIDDKEYKYYKEALKRELK